MNFNKDYFKGDGLNLNNKDEIRHLKEFTKERFRRSSSFQGSQASGVIDKFMEASKKIYGNTKRVSTRERDELFKRLAYDPKLRKEIGLRDSQLRELHETLKYEEPSNEKDAALEEDLDNN